MYGTIDTCGSTNFGGPVTHDHQIDQNTIVLCSYCIYTVITIYCTYTVLFCAQVHTTAPWLFLR